MRNYAILLAVLLTFSLIIPVAADSSATITFAPTAKTTSPGAGFTVTLHVTPTEFNIISGEINLAFDKDVLQVTKYELGSYFTKNMGEWSSYDNGAGTISAVLALQNPGVHSADTSWAKITLQVASDAEIDSTTKVTISDASFSDSDDNELSGDAVTYSDFEVSIVSGEHPTEIESLAYSPIPANKNQDITLTAELSDEDCTTGQENCVSPEWKQVNGTPVQIMTYSRNLHPTYRAYFRTDKAGDYVFNLSLSNDIFQLIEVKVVNVAPAVTILGENSVEVGDGITLSAEVDEDDGDTISHTWNLGERQNSNWGTMQWVFFGSGQKPACVSVDGQTTCENEVDKINIQRLYEDTYDLPVVGEHCACLEELAVVYPDPYFNIYSSNNAEGDTSPPYSIYKTYGSISRCGDQICDGSTCIYDETDSICTIRLLVSDGDETVIATKDITLTDSRKEPLANIEILGHEPYGTMSLGQNNIIKLYNIIIAGITKQITLSGKQSSYYVDGEKIRDSPGPKMKYVWDTDKTDEPWGYIDIDSETSIITCEPEDTGIGSCSGTYPTAFKEVMVTNAVNPNSPAAGDICYCTDDDSNSLFRNKILTGQEVPQTYSLDSCGSDNVCEVELTVTDTAIGKSHSSKVRLNLKSPPNTAPYFVDISGDKVDVFLSAGTPHTETVTFADAEDVETAYADMSYSISRDATIIPLISYGDYADELIIAFTAPEEEGSYNFNLIVEDSGGATAELPFMVYVGVEPAIPVVEITNPEDGASVNIGEELILDAHSLDSNVKIGKYIWHIGRESNPWGLTKSSGGHIKCVKLDGTEECLRDEGQFINDPLSYVNEPCTCEVTYAIDKLWNIYPDSIYESKPIVVTYNNINDCEDAECTITLRAQSESGMISDAVSITVNLQTADGDLNGDGVSDEKDSELLLKYILNPSTKGIVDITKADMDATGINDITINDYILHWDKYGK